MLFHTWTFLFFFAAVYPLYLVAKNTRLRVLWLFLISYVFYGWWNPYYLLLVGYSSFVDWLAVTCMERYGRQKRWLAISVVNNLGMLCFFKYAGFLADNFNTGSAYLNIGYSIQLPDIVLPVGISFFVFQSMSYTIDYYRGRVEREANFLRYATFHSFFPQLVAGPIERAASLLPQLRENPRITREDVTDGASLFLVGLFKKIVMADYLALYVNQVYGAPESYDGIALFVASVAFAWQIYFDFSGYTDMARGIGRIMGFRLMLNFNNPYLATDLGDFWSRWHISLSSWFRDYVYIPLGGSKGGLFTTYRNIFLTMVISGFWHGAAWTFIIWGALHAIGRMGTRELERSTIYRERFPRLVKQVLVFTFVTFTWIFFRAETLPKAWLILTRIFSTSWLTDPRFPLVAAGFIGMIWIYQFLYESRARKVLEYGPVRVACAVAMLVCIVLFASENEQAFIYFQF